MGQVKFNFDNHILDTDRRELRRGADLVAMQPQVFDFLVHLLKHRDRVVSRDDISAPVWGGRIVSDSTRRFPSTTMPCTVCAIALADNGIAMGDATKASLNSTPATIPPRIILIPHLTNSTGSLKTRAPWRRCG